MKSKSHSKVLSRSLSGSYSAQGCRFALVTSRFNQFITERLLTGALDGLLRMGARPLDLQVIRTPGAFEIPAAARRAAATGRYHAIICLGLILRGETPHFDYISREVTRGIGQSAQETGVPHSFGVLTCDTLQEAIDRAGLKAGNKGLEAAQAAVEMANLFRRISSPSPEAEKSKLKNRPRHSRPIQPSQKRNSPERNA